MAPGCDCELVQSTLLMTTELEDTRPASTWAYLTNF